ncbi:hypothetical protein AGMMS50239_01360 [Bacteroidia bacterium]|nr:hypothetical protein AGMMS50239_01360 [Bacteroidia bacterium]
MYQSSKTNRNATDYGSAMETETIQKNGTSLKSLMSRTKFLVVFLAIQDELAKIMNEYLADMSKYATTATSVKIRACYDSIPTQLSKENRKFQYKIAMKGGTTSIFGESIDWLLSAGIVLKCRKIEQGVMPLKGQIDFSDFKLYMSDTGMLTGH